MKHRPLLTLLAFLLGAACCQPASAQTIPTPLAIGQTFTLPSAVLGETRRLNVYLPPGYSDSAIAFPVLYMPDGGLRKTFCTWPPWCR